MSYHIKPEDIDDEAFESMGGDYWADFGMEKEEMADILNAAIEAGLVSPPCWVMRCYGRMTKDMSSEPNIYPSRRDDTEAVSYEHWKGQRE